MLYEVSICLGAVFAFVLLYHCLCLTPGLMAIFYRQLELSHKVAFCSEQFPNGSVIARNWSVGNVYGG